MTWRALVCLLLVLPCLVLGQETKVKPGDTLGIVTAGQIQYSGDYVVASDGTFNMAVVGLFRVEGRSVADVEAEVRRRVRDYVRDADVTVVLRLETPKFVYLLSERVTKAAVTWVPGMDLRQLVSQHPTLGPLDSYDAKFYRGENPAVTIDLVKLVRDGTEDQNFKLEPGDLLALLPESFKSVWVVGSVLRPGEFRIRPDEGVAQAIALAGGLGNSPVSTSEVTVRLRRGDQTSTRPLSSVMSGEPWSVEAGDTVFVELPHMVSVTFGGAVQKPGETQVREGTTVVPAITAAGGPIDEGTLQNVVLFRKGKSQVIDGRAIARGGPDTSPVLEDGDFVYVPLNKSEYFVFGFVMRPGRKLIPDQKDLRMSDALGSAEGLKPNGTYRHAIVLRAGPDGKYVPHKYDFDKYLKDGDASQNPAIEPGDIVFFDQVSGTALSDIIRLVPSLILLDRFF